MPTNASRTRSRDRSARQSPAPSKPSSPTEASVDPTARILPEATADDIGFDAPYGRYNYMNFPSPDNVWRADDFLAIAKAVYEADDIRPPSLFNSSTTSTTSLNEDEDEQPQANNSNENGNNGNHKLPEGLSRKSMSDVRDVLSRMLKALNEKEVSFTPGKSPRNLLSVIASEFTFMTTHAHERNLALFKLVTCRNNLTEASKKKSELLKEQGKMNNQIEKEKERRLRAVKRKGDLEKSKEYAKKRLEKQRNDVDNLLKVLEKARMNDLEVRRKLDRIHLKVGALRGKMVVPTVDQLLVKEIKRKPRQTLVVSNKKEARLLGIGDSDRDLNSPDDMGDVEEDAEEEAQDRRAIGVDGGVDEDNVDVEMDGDMIQQVNTDIDESEQEIAQADETELHPFAKFGFQSVLHCQPWTTTRTEESGSLSGSLSEFNHKDNGASGMLSPSTAAAGAAALTITGAMSISNHNLSGGGGESSDETEVDMDEEAMEFRLLKNRLAMVENEAKEWKATLYAERSRYAMVVRAKGQLEDEVARLKQGNGARGSALRASVKAENRPYSKIRAAVRASISNLEVEHGVGGTTELKVVKVLKKGRKGRKPARGLMAD